MGERAEKRQKEAVALLHDCKLPKAEEIFRGLIKSGNCNPYTYCYLASICGLTNRQGELIELLNKAIKLNPNIAQAHINLARAYHERGDLDASIISFKQALRLKPSDTECMHNLANVYLKNRNFNSAINTYKKLIQAKPRNAEAYSNLGIACQGIGDASAAIDAYKKAITFKPNNLQSYINLAISLRIKGDSRSCIDTYKEAIEQIPNNSSLHYKLGIEFKEQGDLHSAANEIKRAIELNPNSPDVYTQLGLILQEQGDSTGAFNSYREAILLKSSCHYTYNNFGALLQKRGHLDAAVESYRKAIGIEPSHSNAYNNLGTALHEKGDYASAIKCYKKAISIRDSHENSFHNLGAAWHEKGDLISAINSYKKAIELKPSFAEAHTHLAHALLLMQDYKQGWKEYEYRSQKKNTPSKPHAHPKSKRWDGKSLNTEESLLLVSEQGLGDTLQFMRYALHLRKLGFDVSLCAQPCLHKLIICSGIDQKPLTPVQANKLRNGLWIPLLSLPRYLEVNPENPIVSGPYIKTTDELIAKWKKALSTERRPIIGINWQGNPSHEKTGHGKGRSLPLESFSEITSTTSGSFVSLQKGFGSEQLATCSFRDRFVRCQEEIDTTWDFLETAAIIANCDLVITSDTSVAHLAAGMGETTWLILKKIPDWRWGVKSKSSFWYPSMRIFQQKEFGDWQEVMTRIAKELQIHF